MLAETTAGIVVFTLNQGFSKSAVSPLPTATYGTLGSPALWYVSRANIRPGIPSAPRPIPVAPKLVGVAPREGSARSTVKPSAGRALGLLSVTVKLIWMLPVEMRVGQTISPCLVFAAGTSWKLQPG